MNLSQEKLKEILVGSGFISENDFAAAVKTSADFGRDIADVLIFRGLINEDSLSKLISEHLNVPYINVARVVIPENVLGLIPEKIARNFWMVPFKVENRQLFVAMDNPHDFEALELARRQTGLQIVPYYSSHESLRRALAQYKKNIREDFDRVIQENVKKASADADPIKSAEKLPIIKVLDTILSYAVAERASDVHIETMADEVVIRFRIDGILEDILRLNRGIENALIARIKIISNLKIDEHRVPQDGRYKFSMDDGKISLRISIIPGFYAENVVMRLLLETDRPSSLEELGISGVNLKALQTNIKRPHGMLLVTGPTGSGKTTSLYSVLNILNTVEVKICTIEDPIEYGVNRVSQIQVNPKTGLTFAMGLRALLRHDPDIIMVGEIRDPETAKIAVNAAMTGHLVLSTLHTNQAAGAIPRLLDMGVEGYLLASTLNLVVAQRLVRKICPSCLTEYQPNQEAIKKLSNDLSTNLQNQKFYKGKGCAECNHTGYQGRVGIYEAIEVTEEIRNLIANRSTSSQLQAEAIKQGMTTLLQDGLNKVASGLTTIEEVIRVVRQD